MKPSSLAVFSLSTLLVISSLHYSEAKTGDHDSSSPRVVRIEGSKNRGIWQGWGTSLCWMGKVFGDRDDVADLLFTGKDVPIAGTTLPGLEFNIVRYNVGACSWNELPGGRKMQVSKTIRPFRQIEGFWRDPESKDPRNWSWDADANQRAMLKKAQKRGADHFELFSNSPMWWMCANDNPSGSADGKRDNLPEKNYPVFAAYLVAVAKQARDVWGIPFTSIEPFNEATTAYWHANGKQEGCHFDAKSQAAFLPMLRRELDQQGLTDLPITASDESLYDQGVAVWRTFSPEIRSLVKKFNIHGYQYDKGARHTIHEEVVARDHKILWNSEHGDRDAGGLEMARNIHRDFSSLHPTGWCYWQPLDASEGWSMIHADMDKGVFLKPTTKHYVMAQYSRHIRPGMTILDTGEKNVIAALSPGKDKLVLVALNDTPAPAETAFDLPILGFPKASVASWVTETSGEKRYERQTDRTIQDGGFFATLPPKSVTTFEIMLEK